MASHDDEACADTVEGTQPTEPVSPTSDPDLRRGSRIGRYHLVSRLGAGAMGVVWSALDPQLDRKVAIKLVHPGLARSTEASERLLREARAMAKLSHRSVVIVHDAGDADGQLFIAMELVKGTNLGSMLRARDRDTLDDWPRWLALLLDAGRGLAAAHEAGVLHRDFKPDNVLVDESGRACVGDFGLASFGVAAMAERKSLPVLPSLTTSTQLTATGALLGTPVYMSPQQLRGETVDARADQFSFCVACWEALYGARPFTVEQRGLDALVALIDEIEKGVLPSVQSSKVPAEVRAILARGLAADPEARWPDMASLVAALHHATHAAPRRRRATYAIAAGLVAVVVAIAAIVWRSAGAHLTITEKRLFSVSMRSGIALSDDGKRLALSSDRLEVRNLEGPERWSAPLAPGDLVLYLEFDGDAVRFSRQGTHKVERWAYAGDSAITTEIEHVDGDWIARTTRGELVIDRSDLTIVDHGRETRRWPLGGSIAGVAVSFDRRRVAYIETDRFMGRIIVRDVESDSVLRSEPIVSPTGLAWRDASTLVYGSAQANGSESRPRLQQVTVGAQRLGPPVELHGMDSGWFGKLATRGDRIYVIEFHPSPRQRIVERPTISQHDSDTEAVGVGWTPTGDMLLWSRSTDHIERRGASVELTNASFDAEPANATTSGDLVIAALRRPAGRQVIALSLRSGHEKWRSPDQKTLAVRCASDLHPPCFAIRTGATEQIFTIDPDTGVLGAKPIYAGKLEDLAVNDDGTRLLLASPTSEIHEIDTTGTVVATYPTSLTTTRSVAYDPQGGILFAGSLVRNSYQAWALRDGNSTSLTQSGDDILSFVRPSPDGKHVQVLVRAYVPELFELTETRR
ncbi:MAG: serine/threonine-protein kinase [Proteobacteria bacterium]|nr:serine/threonine-protein kinase [Pseudomonadota bacterium]